MPISPFINYSSQFSLMELLRTLSIDDIKIIVSEIIIIYLNRKYIMKPLDCIEMENINSDVKNIIKTFTDEGLLPENCDYSILPDKDTGIITFGWLRKRQNKRSLVTFSWDPDQET